MCARLTSLNKRVTVSHCAPVAPISLIIRLSQKELNEKLKQQLRTAEVIHKPAQILILNAPVL